MPEKNRRKGRPCIGNGPQDMKRTFRFTKEECDKFDTVVKNRGISHTEFIKKVISEAFEMDNKQKQ